tara:strand:+ start:620 stop:2281 length:1662 start_codon:yes stop_codon:yes gene_type:complete
MIKKTLIIILAISFGVGITAQAKQLWEYGVFSERAVVAESIGIEDYEGTYDQNLTLLEWYETQLDSELIFGATLPIAGSTYTLAGSGITSSGASITLQSFTIPQNGYKIQDSDLSDTFYITLEPGSTKRQEIVSCTTVVQNANDTATLSGCTRGLSPITPFTSSSTLQFAHAGGSQVIFSDPPQLFNEYVSLANTQTLTGQKFFDIFPEFSDGTSPTTTNQFATKGYVDNLVNQGAATSSLTVAGISELATRVENASSTVWGATEPHVQQSQHSSSTPSDARTGLWDIWSENDGYLAQGWIDLSETFTWTGLTTFTATSTFSATTTHTRIETSGGLAYKPVQFTATAGEAFTGDTTPQATYLSATSGKAFILDADQNTTSTLEFIGFTITTTADAGTVTIQKDGIVDGFSGLTTGDTYYGQDDESIGTSLGTYEIKVGRAVSATEVLIEKANYHEYMGNESLTVTGNADQRVGKCDVPIDTTLMIIDASYTQGHTTAIEVYKIGRTSGGITHHYGSDTVSLSCGYASDIITCTANESDNHNNAALSGTCYFYR